MRISREHGMSDKTYNVLFVDTNNSARSIIGEAILKRLGVGRFSAYSAGSEGYGTIHPYTLDLLRNLNHPVDDLRSKTWTEFTGFGAPTMDFIFFVCDNAMNRAMQSTAPRFTGEPMIAPWGVPDPTLVEGSEAEKRHAFADVYGQLTRRLEIFVNLPIQGLDRLTIEKRIGEMGR